MRGDRGKRHPWSLARRITLVVSVTIGALFAVSAWLVSRSIDDHFELLDFDELQVVAESLRQALGSAQGRDIPDGHRHDLGHAVAGHHGIHYAVFDGAGQLIYTRAPAALLDATRFAAPAASLDRGAVHVWTAAGDTYRGAVLALEGRRVVVAISTNAHEHYLSDLRRALWAGAIMATLLSVLAAVLAVRWGHAPIRRSGATVKGIPAYGFSKDIGSQESISIYLDRQEIQSRKNKLLWSILGVSIVGIGLAILMAFLIGGSITRPLQTLMNDIQVISGGNFDHRPAARSRDEIGIVARLLGDMAAGLKSAQEVWLENQGRKHDLDIAKEIQENLLPKHVPRIAGYDVSAYYSPSKEVGGDYYDFFLVDKTHLGMICADVSGKGIPGSMVMMMAKALVSYEAQDNLSPRDIFCKVNRTLAKDIKRGMFVTAFYMLLDIPTARLTVASAGHNPLLLYRAATKQCTEVNPGGIALGFDKDGRLFERNMKEEVIQLQRGDRAVIYTDGVTEAMSPSNEEFGEERLQAITIQAAG